MQRTRPDNRSHWSRRAVLQGTALSGASLALGPAPQSRAAESTVHRRSLGSLEITIISDGIMEVPTAMMLPERPVAEVEALFKAAGRSFAGFRPDVNVVIIKSGADLVLIDAGGGPDFMPTIGKLAERMEAAGIAPAAITKVVFTHAHADHFWGVIDPLTDDTLFEKAEHLMSAAEFEHWLQPDIEGRVAAPFRSMATGTQRRLKIVAERVKKVAPGAEIATGLQLVDTRGHTPGHVSVLARGGGEQLLIGGDVLTQSVVSFAQPDWRWGPDMDPDQAIASRKRTLDRLAAERMLLLGYHLPWPGLGRVERHGNAYRFLAG